jgi:hypothetical protein
MRELIGYLVAFEGDEEAAVRMAAGIPQQFLRKEDRADRVRARTDDDSIGAGFAIGRIASSDAARSLPTGSPITIIYAREDSTDDAVEAIAYPIPDFGVSD